MYLKSISIKGFKTFADKTTLEFDPEGSITCIVGPNGCGKSNIIDSLRWVMGEQSLKDLRSTSLDEVIFAGSTLRKPLSLAEVTLTLDNSDRSMKTEYTEVSIKRRIFRSGESEFFINKNPCRLKDIKDLFLDTGLGSGTYSIINQGKVDAILSSRPEERRAPFEEAAGINKYKTRKLAAQRKLIATEQNLLRVNDLKLELSTQLSSLEEQSKKAREYMDIKERLKKTEIAICKKEMKSVDQRKNSLKEKTESLRSRLEKGRIEAEEAENKRSRLKIETKEKEEELERLQKEIEAALSELEGKKRDLGIELEREANLKDRLARASKDSEKLIPIAAAHREHVKELSEEKSILAAKNEEAKADVAALEAKAGGAEERIRSNLEKMRLAKERIFNAERESSAKRNDLLELDGSKRFAEEELRRDEASRERLQKESSELKKKVGALDAELILKEKKLSSLTSNLNILIDEQNKIETELNILQIKKDETREKLSSADSKLKLLKEMESGAFGYAEGIKESLKEAGHGLAEAHGILTEVIKIKEGYEKAVESALEYYLETIIVKDAEAARKFVKHLKKTNSGRASFIVLDPSRASAKSQKITSKKGFLGFASEFVLAKEGVAPLLNSFLANFAVVDTFDHALDIYIDCLKDPKEDLPVRISTLDGEAITPRLGKISGGGAGTRGKSGREKEIAALEGETQRLRGALESVLQQESSLQSAKIEKSEAISAGSEESLNFKIELGALKHSKEALAGQLKEASDESQLISQSVEARKKEKQEISESQAALSAEAKTLEEECASLAESLRKLDEDTEKERAASGSLNQELTGAKISLAGEETRLNQVEAEISSALENLNRIEAELGEESIKETEEKLAAATKRIQEITASLPVIEDKKREMEAKEASDKIARSRIAEEIEALDASIRKSGEEERGISDKLSKEEISLAKLEGEESAMAERMKEEYGITAEEIMSSEEDVQSIPQAKKDSEEMRLRLRALEPVNLLAIDEFGKAKERVEFIQGQYEDLKEARENLSLLIRELDSKARENFVKTIQAVGENFSMIFATLFEGGEAKLILVEGEDILDAGIEIMAKPHGKKWLSLSLLSGGERALTAIAILFALLKTHPSPFSFLDEVDAALDDANVFRFTKMLGEFSKDIQMVVVTHNKRTMATAKALYGVTMEEPGISKLVSMKLAGTA